MACPLRQRGQSPAVASFIASKGLFLLHVVSNCLIHFFGVLFLVQWPTVPDGETRSRGNAAATARTHAMAQDKRR